MKRTVWGIIFLFTLSTLGGQDFHKDQWHYIAIDSVKQKWGDWDEPGWLRYFGLDFCDANRDGFLDIASGRYLYTNPGGDMTGSWNRTVLDDNVDAILSLDVDGDPYTDLIAQALPDIFWYESLNEQGTLFMRRKIAEVPATSHVNSQGFKKGQMTPGGKPEILIAGNGDVYCISIPETIEEGKLFPTYLIGANTSDEGIGIGDIDGDGDMDFTCGRRPPGGEEPLMAVWFENPGTLDRSWEDHIVGRSEKPMDRFEVADLNNDGNADIIVSEERYPGLEPDAGLYWFSFNDEAGGWDKHLIVTQYSMNNLDVADLDGDGDLDIVTSEHKGPNLELQIWENDGAGNFRKNTIDTGKENHLGTRLADLDSDGDLDIAGAAWDNHRWMHVWRNDRNNQNGKVFREYKWEPSQHIEDEGFLRVGGRLDYISSPDHFKNKEILHDGCIRIAEDIDLDKAVRAELILEKLQSHDDTKNLRIQVNQHPWIPVHEPAGIPAPASRYMYHFAPVVNVPLNYLEERRVDLKLAVDEDQRWDWPQNIFYGFILRIFYGDKKAEIPFRVKLSTSSDTTVTFWLDGELPPDIKRVDYMGHYEEINWQGDGIYRQWQYNLFRTGIRNHIGGSMEKPFSVRWNTAWIPNQNQPVKIKARIERTSGIVQMTEEVILALPERAFDVLLLKPFGIPPNWVTREKEYTESFIVPVDPGNILEATLHWRSWSPCYAAGIKMNGITISEEEGWPCYDYYEHVLRLDDISLLRKGENRLTTALTPLNNGSMVHGMEVQWPGIQLKLKIQKMEKETVKINEIHYEGREHYRIETDRIIWYYDKAGGGFSRMIDRDGSDWISFRKEPWGEYPASAASSFRGVPNLVFGGGDDGAGHPGHDRCRSWSEGNRIITESINGKWKWVWAFEPDHAILSVQETDTSRNYWFLYEGTPGGKFTPHDYYYGTSAFAPSDEMIDFYKGETIFTDYRWIFAGSSVSESALYMVQTYPDQHTDMYGFLGNTDQGIASGDGMTVFGFGRSENTTPLLSGPQEFVIGLYNGRVATPREYERFNHYVEGILEERNMK